MLAEYCLPLVKVGGQFLAMKSVSSDDEIAGARGAIGQLGGRIADIRDYTVPETEVRHCAFIRGSALVGAGCVVGNSVELKNVILFDGVQTPHYNYVGDSILGYKSHMGAGSITSNVKSDKLPVVVRCGQERMDTGRKKVGAMLGDFVEVGCNSVLNPGTVIGRHSIIYPTSCVRGVLAENSIHKNDGTVITRK